jgi:hypothetical protein
VTEQFGKPAAPAGKGRGQAEDRADGVPRDARGGYVLPSLDGSPPLTHKNGNPIGRVRASTIKNHVTDKTGVSKWRVDMVQTGLAKDPALAAENMKAVAAEDKTWIRNVGERAFIVGGGKVAADRGTEFHELTERIKKGEQISPDEIHESLAAVDVDAYLQLLAEVNLRPVPGMQERVVLLEHGGGGTFDDMFEWFNPDTEQYELLIGDTKSGRDIWKYGSLEIIAQMIQYTRAQGIWRSPKDGGAEPWGDYLPMPAVSQSHVAIVHAPQNGTAEAFIVDITGAQEVIDAALTIRRWQSDAKHRVRSIGKVDLREAAYVAPAPVDQTEVESTFPAQVQAWEIMDKAATAEPNGPWAPTKTHTTAEVGALVAEGIQHGRLQVSPPPTPDQLAQIDKRNERLAVAAETVARVAAASDPNTDGDGELNPQAMAKERAARGDDGALAPLAGPGKRGCGVCGRTGHKRGSPKCLGDADPATGRAAKQAMTDEGKTGEQVYAEDEARRSAPALGTEPITEAERELVVGEIVGGITVPAYLADHGLARPPESAPTAVTAGPSTFPGQVTAEELPYCHLAHAHEWTSIHPAAPGHWVCETTGKPSKDVWDNRPNPTPIDPQDTVVAPHWTTPPDMIAWAISQAMNQAGVLQIRAANITAGTWSDAYESQAQARYQALGS